jgi:hypothetical protein
MESIRNLANDERARAAFCEREKHRIARARVGRHARRSAARPTDDSCARP